MIRVLKNIFFVLWNLSIITFFFASIYSILSIPVSFFNEDTTIPTIFLFGVASFIIFGICYVAENKSKPRLRDILYVVIPATLVLFGFIVIIIAHNTELRDAKIRSLEKQLEKIENNVVSKTQPVIVIQPKMVDPDPMINCNVHENCGGGTRYVKNSVCGNSTCCKVGDHWIFYLSKDECNKDQKKYQEELLKEIQEEKDYEDNYLYDYDLPTYSLPVYTPPVYTPPQKTEEEIALEIEQCKREVSSRYASLIRNCSSYGDTSAYEVCVKVYTDKANEERKACEY